MLDIVEAATPEQLVQVRALMLAFVDWCRVRYAAHLDQINTYFDGPAFGAELAGLPGAYARPRGRLLLALHGSHAVGCVGLRPFDAVSCEMKRMFVTPAAQGQGVGRALAETLLREAKASGYSRMLLDTGFLQTEAQALYRSLGFVAIAPYYPAPEVVRRGTLFMERSLLE